jgi:predicted nucleotidyltransferase/HEPN domain-containing protein
MDRYSPYSLDETRDTHEKMRSDLNHLPEEKQRELGQISKVLGEMDGVEMVILYGSYARGGWKEEKDLKPGRWSGHSSDYDILVITQEPPQSGFEGKVREVINNPRLSAHADPIVHDIEDINEQLSEGRYFFLDIKREGRMLYNTERFGLAEPRELTKEESHTLAQADFDSWYKQATGFYDGYEFYYGKENLRLAIFNLNQATESAYKAILLVFTSYCPHEHMLEWLGYEVERFGPVFRDIFPNDTRESEAYFNLMNRAYIGARYQKDFIVHWHDVDYLAPRVKQLLAVTERICRKEIASIMEEM